MLLDDLKENDTVVFSDGVCAEVSACNVNKQRAIVSIAFGRKVAGIQETPRLLCWTYKLDGTLWIGDPITNNNIVKVIHA